MDPIIRVRELKKSFGHVEVLKGISIDVAPGEVMGIIGPSGSGKSTFLRCLNSLEDFQSGDLRVCGEFVGYRPEQSGVLRALSDKELARQRTRTGMVFQRFNLFANMTVMENVTCGLIAVLRMNRVDARREAQACLEKVGMGPFVGRYPAQLSGGQQQRVAIARAIAMHPEVLLFDEPTSALDSELVEEVLSVIRDLAGQGLTMVLVTHELAFARDICDRVTFMEAGQIVECAPASMLFTTPQTPRARAFLQRFLAQA